MAGTLFGLPMSQRVDLNGIPSVGWLLYLFQANTSTPVNSYQDTGLTVLNTWPLAADASGMMGVFWVADGSYRARGTNADGSIVYFDIPNILAIGASTGAPPPSGVDPAAIFQVGDVMWLDVVGVRAGWVRDNARTIGSASSGATERANADCQNLFQFLWSNYDDSLCPVDGGRGASANADWVANKRIHTPDKRGVVPGGMDSMGGGDTNYWDTSFVAGFADNRAGVIGGEMQHHLVEAEIPPHSHAGTTAGTNQDLTHTHDYQLAGSPVQKPNSAGTAPFTGLSTSQTGGPSVSMNHDHDFSTNNGTGGDQPHNNVQRTVIGTFYRKL